MRLLSNFFSVLIEIPGYVFCIIVMDCWGRRPILSFCQIVSGVACIGCGLLQGQPQLQALQVWASHIHIFFAVKYLLAEICNVQITFKPVPVIKY